MSGAAVPETPVDENNYALAAECEIGFAEMFLTTTPASNSMHP